MAITKVINDLIDLNATDATKSLKMPSGAAYSGTAQDGMVRNDTDGDSQGSASTMQHFNGTDWKNYENLSNSITADFLVVAGGAGSGSNFAGGSGAGGLRTSYGAETGGSVTPAETALSLSTATAYTITIGVGGAGAPNGTSQTGVNGGASSISGSDITDITTVGGGRGDFGGSGSTGGSIGGSGGGRAAANGSGYAGTAGQGKAGGNSTTTNGGTAGGGGCTGVGGNQVGSGASGPGGAGLAVAITGTSLSYAGGGGGGTYNNTSTSNIGGVGGGGNGGVHTIASGVITQATSGVISTGGGGGGGSAGSSAGGGGGAGIVILRYPTASVASYQLDASSGLDTTANTAYPIANTAYYKLEGGSGTTVTDSSGNGNNGVSTSVTYAAGRFGQAAVFNGTNSTIATPITTNYSNLSISCWVKFTALPTGGADATLVSKGFYTSGSSTQYLHLRYEDNLSKGFTFAIRNNSAYNSQAVAGVNAIIGVWYHVVGTLDSSGNAQIYVNGAAGTGITGAPSMTNSNAFEIGSFISTSALLNGSIDQVRIFNSVISAGNVTSLYNESTVNESTDGTDSILQFIGGTGTVTFS
mgnify:FL=1